LERLKARHGWDGVLVFAGPTVPYGGSKRQEAQFLSAHAHLATSVLDLGPVTEAEKDWLFARAALVAYPSVLEGFGLVPFGAGGRPCPPTGMSPPPCGAGKSSATAWPQLSGGGVGGARRQGSDGPPRGGAASAGARGAGRGRSVRRGPARVWGRPPLTCVAAA